MIRLLLLQLKTFPLCLVCLGGGWITYLVDTRSHELYPQAAYMLGFFLTAGVAASVINRELRDFTGGGYVFLKTLPLTNQEVVQAKFLAFLIDIACSWLLVIALFVSLPAPPGVLALNVSYITTWSLAAAVVISLWYASVYRYGLGASALILTLFLIGFLLPLSLIFDQAIDFSATRGFPRLIDYLARSHPVVWISVALLILSLCLGLFRFAVSIKKKHEIL